MAPYMQTVAALTRMLPRMFKVAAWLDSRQWRLGDTALYRVYGNGQ